MRIFSLRFWSLALGVHLAMLVSGCSNDPIRQTSSGAPTVNEMPTQDEFYLKVENLVVGYLHVSRITILALNGKTLRFHIGTAGTGTRTRGVRTPEDPVDVRRLEVVLVLRLRPVAAPGASIITAPTKLRAIVQYDQGGGMETDFDAPNAATLKDVVTVSPLSGRYAIGKPVIIGRILDKDLTAWVE